MSEFNDLDQYLSQDHPDDYWADEAILYAHELIRALSAVGWRELRALWRTRDEQWQTRCAQILAHGEQSLAVKLLMDMVKLGGPEIRITALDSMREAALTKLSAVDRAHLLAEANHLMGSASSVEAAILSDLRLKLGTKS